MRLLAVLVLYRTALHQSRTFLSLAQAVRSSVDLALLVYDNSERPQVTTDVGIPESLRPFHYLHDPTNGGLAAAYNRALYLARDIRADWLLLLDQDTQLPPAFIEQTAGVIESLPENGDIVAVVPRVHSNRCCISPMRVRRGWRLAAFPDAATGCIDVPATAINSGTAVSVAFLDGLGGFDPTFKLDYLDHWLFRSIHIAGKKIYLSPQAIEHDLSILDLASNVGRERYESILGGEASFFHRFGTRSERMAYLARLAVRGARQAVAARTRGHAALTFDRLRREMGLGGA